MACRDDFPMFVDSFDDILMLMMLMIRMMKMFTRLLIISKSFWCVFDRMRKNPKPKRSDGRIGIARIFYSILLVKKSSDRIYTKNRDDLFSNWIHKWLLCNKNLWFYAKKIQHCFGVDDDDVDDGVFVNLFFLKNLEFHRNSSIPEDSD